MTEPSSLVALVVGGTRPVHNVSFRQEAAVGGIGVETGSVEVSEKVIRVDRVGDLYNPLNMHQNSL